MSNVLAESHYLPQRPDRPPRDASTRTAYLLTGLLDQLVSADSPSSLTTLCNATRPCVVSTTTPAAAFPRFPELPPELRDMIFDLAFEEHVIKLYWAGHQALDSQPSPGPGPGPGPPVVEGERRRRPSSCGFYASRPIRTIPLFHVCDAARKRAIRRYGQPDAFTLPYDPKLDTLRFCGQWPSDLRRTQRFVLLEPPTSPAASPFAGCTSVQLHASAFSSAVDHPIHPDILAAGYWSPYQFPRPGTRGREPNNPFIPLQAAFCWAKENLPRLERLAFSMSTEDLEDEKLIMVDLINISMCLVLAEAGRVPAPGHFCVPRLKAIAVEFGPE